MSILPYIKKRSMCIIGGAVLIASVEVLVTRLASSDMLIIDRRVNHSSQHLRMILMRIYPVLEDAEEKQLTNRFVMQWLVDLKNLVCDVENILDELEAKAASRNVLKIITNFIFYRKKEYQMKIITARLEEIVTQMKDLHLCDLHLYANSEGRSINKVRYQRLHTASLIEAHIYGREKDQEAILDLVLNDKCNEDGFSFSVIPIVGMAGIGKTILAQNVYDDPKVKSCFDLISWVYVSDDFDVVRITRRILECIHCHYRHSDDLNQLQVKLRECLSSKKFLIVLDDIWNEDYEKWTALFDQFRVGCRGSKVIITTRSDHISSLVSNHPTNYHLNELSFDDSLSLFTHHSLGKKDFNEHKDLKEVGEKIVCKCKGLPLALKTLGGLLRHKVNLDDWEHVLNSKIWNLSQEGIFFALRLSYHHLPPHLKRCFAYFSTVPKDYEFEKEEIVQLWMEEGVLLEKSCDIMEDLLGDYFFDLQSRSFFQESTSDTKRYVMHEFVHELAEWASGEAFFEFAKNDLHYNKKDRGSSTAIVDSGGGGNSGGGGGSSGGGDRGDDGNGGGGGNDKKKDRGVDGDSDGNDEDKAEKGGGIGDTMRSKMDFKGEPGFDYDFENHGGSENGCPTGQLEFPQKIEQSQLDLSSFTFVFYISVKRVVFGNKNHEEKERAGDDSHLSIRMIPSSF